MTNTLRSVLLVIACLPVQSAAKEITVRAGEHEDFSRLVIYTKQSDQISFSRTSDGYVFGSGDVKNTYNLAEVFRLIPRTRVADLSLSADGELGISLACECYAKTETLPNGQFVIDIVDGKIEENDTVNFLDPEMPEQSVSKADIAPPRTARLGLPISSTTQRVSVHTETRKATFNVPKVTAATNVDMPQVQSREQALLEQLSRAAAQGLVKAVVDPHLSPEKAEPELTHAPKDAEPKSETASPTESESHLAIQTSFDRETAETTSSNGTTDEGGRCLPDTSFAIADWGPESSDHLDFSAFQRELMGEFDRLHPETLEQLVRHQIYLSLGAEARSYIKAFATDLPDRANLLTISDILENGASEDFARLTAQMVCDGPVALWAVLAQPELPKSPKPNGQTLLREFSKLPTHLRSLLGPMLIRKLLAADETETSFEINQIMNRSVSEPNSDRLLASARVSASLGASSDALGQLEGLVTEDDKTAIEAMLLLVQTHIQKDLGISEKNLDILSALRHENQGSSSGEALATAEIRARVFMAQFDTAIELLNDLPAFPATGETSHDQVLSELSSALSEKASDSTFLRYVLGQSFWKVASEHSRMLVANRLLQLGFATSAKKLVSSSQAPPSRAARVLIARASLIEGNPNVALGFITGLHDPDAKEIRALALAARETQSETATDGSDQTQITEPSNISPTEEAATMSPSTLAPSRGLAPTIASSQKLIEESEAARAMLEGLLSN